MLPANIRIVGTGFVLSPRDRRPACVVYTGGYDAVQNVLYLASVMSHPQGVAMAGGDPSSDCNSGIRVFRTADKQTAWANDSMSLPRRLTDEEADAVQRGLEGYFCGDIVRRIKEGDELALNTVVGNDE